MTDNDWVRAINDKNIYTGGQVRGGAFVQMTVFLLVGSYSLTK